MIIAVHVKLKLDFSVLCDLKVEICNNGIQRDIENKR